MTLALALLILETHNDYVRFHGTFICTTCGNLSRLQLLFDPLAYQSGLLSAPLVLLRLLVSLLQFPQWFRSMISLLIMIALLIMAYACPPFMASHSFLIRNMTARKHSLMLLNTASHDISYLTLDKLPNDGSRKSSILHAYTLVLWTVKASDQLVVLD